MKSIYIETLGCSKNLVDSEQMLGILDDHYKLSETPEEADVIIVNTCSFINDAKQESLDVILEFSELKKQGLCEKLVVAGCLSQRYPDEVLEEIPSVDAVIGTSNFYEIVQILASIYEDSTRKKYLESVDLLIPEGLPRIMTTPSYTGYLKIAEGCDNKCTYCIIPKLRGKYRSRLMEDLVEEAEDLVKMGIKEIIIIAQDTSRYGLDIYHRPMLPELLTRLNNIEGIKWIRVQYSYPDIIDENILNGFLKNSKVVNYFDIPIQHASNEILKKMNRKTTQEGIKILVDKIRRMDNQAIIRSTVIVGFPGETQNDFDELIKFIKDVKFDRLGAFAYSDEEDTPAFDLPDHLDDEIIQSRRDQLMTVQMGISEQICFTKIGKTFEVLIEEVADEGKILVGRTAYDAPEIDGVVYVHTEEPIRIGEFVNVKITDALEYDLIGVIEHEHS